MSDVRDLFIRSLDGEKSGLHGQIQAFENLLSRQDPLVAKHLKDLEIHTQFFAVRPLTTLLTREFELPDALRLWDSMLGSKKRFHFIMCACVALITTKRVFLLENDFPTCLKALQSTCTLPIDKIVTEAERISQNELIRQPKNRNESLTMAMDLLRKAAKAAQKVVEEVVDDFIDRSPPGSFQTPPPQLTESKNNLHHQRIGSKVKPLINKNGDTRNHDSSDNNVPFTRSSSPSSVTAASFENQDED